MSSDSTTARSASEKGDKPAMTARVTINKAYKMYVGGAFIRSESGRYFQVGGEHVDGHADPDVVNIPLGSRKDVRDAVGIARTAFESWAARTAYNRGQILYRLAEVMEPRKHELVASLVRAGVTAAQAKAEVDLAIDRAVHYAGFADKISSLASSHNPVSGPHFGFSVPEPMGIVGIVAPDSPTLIGLVSTILPVIVSGNSCVVVATDKDPRTAIAFAECLATSDLPGGVVNILTGRSAEMSPHLATHREVAALDVWTADVELSKRLEADGSGSVKRVRVHRAADAERLRDSSLGAGLSFIERFLETKTVWHPSGV